MEEMKKLNSNISKQKEHDIFYAKSSVIILITQFYPKNCDYCCFFNIKTESCNKFDNINGLSCYNCIFKDITDEL